MLGVPLVALTAQPSDLIMSNSSGITVRPSPEQPSVPLLWVTLPGMAGQRCIVIELPEHSWGRPRGTAEQGWFYRMYSPDSALRPPTRWEKHGQLLTSSLSTPAGVRLETTVKLEDDGILMTHRLDNQRDVDYEVVQAPTCIKLYRPFSDVFLERTYVHHPDGLELLASETPGRFAMNAEEWLPSRYIVRCTPPAVSAEDRVRRQSDGIFYYQKMRLADAPFIATVSSPAGWVAGSHTYAASSIFTNPARTCHHVDPSAALKPGNTVVLSLKVYLVRGTAQDVWRLVSNSRGQRKA